MSPPTTPSDRKPEARLSEVREYSFDGKALGKPAIATGIKAFFAASLVNGPNGADAGKVAVLTRDALTLYRASGSSLVLLEDVVSFKKEKRVQAGFFSPNGLYLVTSFNDGSAGVYNVKTSAQNPLQFSGDKKRPPGDPEILLSAAF